MTELLLLDANAQSEGVITRIDQGRPEQVSKLMALGLTPGRKIRIHQTQPQFIISIENTLLGFDAEMASSIYFTPVSS